MPRYKSFTFKYFYEIDAMAVTRYCQDTEPNEEVWNEINDAEFFDIKLCPYISIKKYIPIMYKINDVTKHGGCKIHFSNELIDIFSKEHEERFWELIKYITHFNYELQIEYKISTVRRDIFRMPTEFFNEVLSFAEKHNIPNIKLSVLDKDSLEHLFFRK